MAGAHEKALLHDLDQKFENQDRMINFVLQQVTNLENQIATSSNMVRNNVDVDRDSIIKLKTDLRSTADQSNAT